MLVDYGPHLRSFLMADPTIAGMVGNRIWPQPLPQATALPAITYVQAGGPDVPVHTTGRSGHRGPRIQVDNWGNDRDQAVALDLAVLDRLAAFRGDMAGLAVQGVFPEEPQGGDFEPEVEHARVIRDYFIWLVG